MKRALLLIPLVIVSGDRRFPLPGLFLDPRDSARR